MALEFMDKISRFIPSIKSPAKPLSLREKMLWTAGILSVYFLLYNTYAIGVNPAQITEPLEQLISIIFAARIGSLITVGISPIVLSSIVLQLLAGSDVLKIDMNDMAQKARFQSLQKLAAMGIAIIEAIIYVETSYVSVTAPSYTIVVILQLILGAFIIINLDEMMTKY